MELADTDLEAMTSLRGWKRDHAITRQGQPDEARKPEDLGSRREPAGWSI